MVRRRGRGADDGPGGKRDAAEPQDEPAEERRASRASSRPARKDADESGFSRKNGPWDAGELDDPYDARVDLGGLLVPKVPGLQIQLNLAAQQVMAVTLVLGKSALQLFPFAAPRSEGLWDDVRDEIASQIARDGGVVDRGVGPFGPELRAQISVPLPDGKQGAQVLRLIGADGPRWFLRGHIMGTAAVQREAAAQIEAVFRQVVVVRGSEAMAPRDPLPLTMPKEAAAVEDQAAPQEPVSPYSGKMQVLQQRGPEITEIR
ncbi:MAG TPA: DUF3710 domain-containing protein [Actinocrinis sp.]|jgi:hypothetical protein